jgi:hypothetical protein
MNEKNAKRIMEIERVIEAYKDTIAWFEKQEQERKERERREREKQEQEKQEKNAA